MPAAIDELRELLQDHVSLAEMYWRHRVVPQHEDPRRLALVQLHRAEEILEEWRSLHAHHGAHTDGLFVDIEADIRQAQAAAMLVHPDANAKREEEVRPRSTVAPTPALTYLFRGH